MITDSEKLDIYYKWTEKQEFPDSAAITAAIDERYPAIKEAERHMKLANILMDSVMADIDQDNVFNLNKHGE